QILHFNYFIYNSIVIYSAPLFEYYAHCERSDAAISSDKDEIATLPSVARNDAFIFNIITESVTELLS
ncbi:hypothetical protein LCGC14_0765360, partial [marine sediment metagenome]